MAPLDWSVRADDAMQRSGGHTFRFLVGSSNRFLAAVLGLVAHLDIAGTAAAETAKEIVFCIVIGLLLLLPHGLAQSFTLREVSQCLIAPHSSV